MRRARQAVIRGTCSNRAERGAKPFSLLDTDRRRVHQILNSPDATDTETEFVMSDRLRVLERIAADLDELARSHSAAQTVIGTSEEDTRARHRRRLVEPPPQPRRLSQREERAEL